jgi:hypothetical protein
VEPCGFLRRETTADCGKRFQRAHSSDRKPGVPLRSTPGYPRSSHRDDSEATRAVLASWAVFGAAKSATSA